MNGSRDDFKVSYSRDEFGSRLSTDFIQIDRRSTIKEAMKILISKAAKNDNVYILFVTEEDGSLYGSVRLKDLIRAREGESFESLVAKNVFYLFDTDIIREKIRYLRESEEELIPILSSQSGRILGVIDAHDITDILDEELGNDYAKLAALTGEEEEENESFSKSMKKRIPWLIILLFLGLIVSAAVSIFEKVVNELPMIVAFQSLILGMAGNVGTQSLAVTVRSLGDKKDLGLRQQLSLIFKETKIAFLNGAVISAVSFITVAVYMLTLERYDQVFVLPTAACVGAAMCLSMMISGFTGTAIPITLYRLDADPAVASGPLITTINDLAAVISYYGFAFALLFKAT